MGEAPAIKTLDCPEPYEFRETHNPISESLNRYSNVGDAQSLNCLYQSIQEFQGSGEIEDAQVAKILEKSPLEGDSLTCETLQKQRREEIEDGLFVETLVDSIEADMNSRHGLGGGSLGKRKSQSDAMKDPLSEALQSPRLSQCESSIGRKRMRDPYCSSDDQNLSMVNSLDADQFYGNSNESIVLPNFTFNESEVSPFFSQRWNEAELCPVGAGLANLGNTCFLNAIMQCFTHTVPLVQGLLSLKHDPSIHGEDEFCVLCAVRSQIEWALMHSGRVISPSALVDNLNHISSFFHRYQQEDAHEFLQCLLDKLDTNWSKFEANPNGSSSKDSLVKQIFGGRLVSQIRCRKCGHSSNTYEPLIDLSLEIENVENLESALKSFTKVESIDDTEKFMCEGCKEQVPVEKQLILDQVPSVAALHLKRFKSDGYYVEKIDKKVDFPLELDLKPYTKDAEYGNEELNYELFAVVVHNGQSSTSGHYFCYIRTAPDAWYRFDDSKVTRVPEATALCQEAYILFYARNGTEWFSDFFGKWKAFSEQKVLRASPKSVLDDKDLPSTSSCQKPENNGCEAAQKQDAAESSFEPSVREMPHSNFAVETQHSEPAVTPTPPSLNGHSEEEVKIDRPDFDFQSSPEKRIDNETCAPSNVLINLEIDPCTPPRSQSPDIYSDGEDAETRYLIPVDHLKVAEKTASSAKKAMDKAKNDVKRKAAARYMSKSMPSRRRNLLMAAMMGPQTDNYMNKKRRKQAASFLHEKHSPKKTSKISPKRVLRPVVA